MIHPLVYIIIVNYRGHNDTIECLESVLRLEYNNYRIIVVDNSQDNDKSLEQIKLWAEGKYALKTQFPDILPTALLKPIRYKIVRDSDKGFNLTQDNSILFYSLSVNRGFAHGNNSAIKYVLSGDDGDFFWLLNNDTIVEKSALVELVKYHQKRNKKNLGIVGSKLLYYFRRDTIQGIGATYNKWLGIIKEVAKGEKDSDQWNNNKFKIDYVIGASMFVSRKFISEVGLMDENLFLYFEELDWAQRGKKKKFDLGYCPSSKIYHKLGSSINQKEKYSSELSDFYAVRNKILITKKYFKGLPVLTLYFSFIFFILNRIRRGQWSRIKVFIKAVRSARDSSLDNMEE